jgi:hypothetical protein
MVCVAGDRRIAGLLWVAFSLSSVAGGTVRASDRLAEARAVFDSGGYRRALDLLKPLLKSSDRDPEPRLIAAESFLALHDSASARKQVDWLREHDPAEPRLASLDGRTLFLESEVERGLGHADAAKAGAAAAAAEIEKALRTAPSDATLLSYRAVALWRAGEIDASLAAHRAWIAAHPDDPSAFGSAARVAAEAGRWSSVAALANLFPADDSAAAREDALHVLRSAIQFGADPSLLGVLDRAESPTDSPRQVAVLGAYRALLSPDADLPDAVIRAFDAGPAEADRVAIRKATMAALNAPPPLRRHRRLAEGTRPERLVHSVPIPYPDVALRTGVTTDLVLVYRVMTDGTVSSIHVLSAPYPTFEKPAIAAISQYRYLPATLDSRPVDVPVVYRIHYWITR